MKKLMQYIKPYGAVMLLGLLIKLIGSVADLVIPSILAKILDDVVPLGRTGPVFEWGFVMLFCAVVACAGNIIANRMSAKSSGHVTENLRHDLFEKISYLSCSQTDKFTISTLVSRLTSDTYNVNQMLNRTQRIGVRAPILLVGGIIVTMTLDKVLSLVLILLMPFIAVIVLFITNKSIPIYKNVQRKLDVMVRTVQENITGIRVIKALSGGNRERERFHDISGDLSDEEQRAESLTAVTNPVTTFILNFGLTAVVAVGAFRVNGGMTQAGKIIAFLSYFTMILNAMIGISKIFVVYSKGAASAERIADVLEEKSEFEVISSENRHTDSIVSFENVSFSYNKVKNNISDINFAIKEGDTLGIIGATGSGKSTIVNLLLRFYDPDSGTVYLDGKNIKSMQRKEISGLFGTVFQNDFIMSGTVKENILYGREISDTDVSRAVADSQAEDFVNEESEGLSYNVTSRGTNISGGQKQRILIARALASNPKILVLDDSSSALDYETDARLRKTLYTKYKNTTKIIIAQRISSLRNADKILVVSGGRISDCGTHDELMRNCEEYKSIAQSQMGGDLLE